MVSPTSLRLVGASFTGLAAPNINNAESRFPCWPEEAYRTRGGEYKKKIPHFRYFGHSCPIGPQAAWRLSRQRNALPEGLAFTGEHHLHA